MGKKKKNSSFVVVKVGTDERPAEKKDIKMISKAFKKFQKKHGCFKNVDILVTHHAINLDFGFSDRGIN